MENPLLINFITCVLGVVVMFFWIVVLLPVRRIPIHMSRVIEASNMVLAGFIAVTVVWISATALRFSAIWLSVSPLVAFLLYCYLHLTQKKQHQNRNSEDNPVIIDIHQEGEPGDQQHYVNEYPVQSLVQNSPKEPHVINTTQSQDLDGHSIDVMQAEVKDRPVDQQGIKGTQSHQHDEADEHSTDTDQDMLKSPKED